MKILVTGSAGFIGFFLSKRLLEQGNKIVGIDNLNDYYDINLKKSRLEQLQVFDDFVFVKDDIANRGMITELFELNRFDVVVNLAAQAGVRYSIKNPYAYIDSNLMGFGNILEACRQTKVKHLVYASSSSVYGANTKMPFSVNDNVDHPVSLYAATKKSNELMAHSYSHLYKIPMTGLRFFTVYGPWGRPDMAYYKFTKAILNNEPIDVYNHGAMKRDFTYIDDIVEGVVRVIGKIPAPVSFGAKNGDNDTIKIENTGKFTAPYKIYNIGNNKPVDLLKFITVLENALGKKAVKNMLPMQPGDVPVTYADIDDLIKDVGFSPSITIEDGLERFVRWVKDSLKNKL